MESPFITEFLGDHKASVWGDLFGAVEAKHLGESPSWPADTFLKHFFFD